MNSNNVLIPIVVEKNPNGFERSYDIYSRLLEDYIVFVTGEVEMGMANTFIAQLLFLESKDPSRDINVYINSPGGVISSGLAMYDTMKHIKNDVATINVGLAASMGAILLSGGTKGKRFILPKAETMIHQPLIMGGLEGQATDIEISSKHLLRSRDVLTDILAENTGQKRDKIMKDIDRNNWMNAEETVKYGLADKIMEPRKAK